MRGSQVDDGTRSSAVLVNFDLVRPLLDSALMLRCCRAGPGCRTAPLARRRTMSSKPGSVEDVAAGRCRGPASG